MNSPKIFVAGALCLAAAGLSGWFLFQRNRGAGSPDGADRSAPAATSDAAELTAPFPKFERKDYGSKEFNKVCRDRLVKWLDVHRKDAASLIAAADIASDREFLQKAADTYPEDPRVCMAIISRDIDTEVWINRLIFFDRDNPAGHLLKAEFLAKSNHADEAIEELQKVSLQKGPPDYYVRQRVVAVREAAAGIGLPAWETAMICRLVPALRPEISTRVSGVLKKELQAAKDSGDRNRVEKAATLCAITGFQISNADMATKTDQMIGIFTQITGLSVLDAGSKWRGTDETVGQRLADVKRQEGELRERFAKIKDKTMDLLKASGPQLLEFEDRLLSDGEMAAEIWFHETAAAQPKAGE